MLNPLKHLRGKLNHLRLTNTHFFRAVQLANSITSHPQNTHFNNTSLEEIQTLKSDTLHINPRIFHKFQFDLMVHSDNAAYSASSTIFDSLNPHQRKISHAVTKYTSNLGPRHLLYLNLLLRKKLNNEYTGWQTLHLSPDAPFKVQIQVLPSLISGSRIHQLRGLPKKGVMKEALKAKKKQ